MTKYPEFKSFADIPASERDIIGALCLITEIGRGNILDSIHHLLEEETTGGRHGEAITDYIVALNGIHIDCVRYQKLYDSMPDEGETPLKSVP